MCWMCTYRNIFIIVCKKYCKVHFALIYFFGFETYRLIGRRLVVARNWSLAWAWWVQPRFLVGSCYSIFSFLCMFCRSLCVMLSVFFWLLCCLFLFDLRILITSLGIIKLFLLNNNRSLDCLTIHFWSCWCHSTTGGHILLLIKFTFSMLTFGKEVLWNIWLIQ